MDWISPSNEMLRKQGQFKALNARLEEMECGSVEPMLIERRRWSLLAVAINREEQMATWPGNFHAIEEMVADALRASGYTVTPAASEPE